MSTKIISIIASIALILGIVGLFTGGATQPLGGESHFSGPVDSAGGYKVDDTIVIDGDGNVDASITSDTGTFSSTLTVSGETNLDTMVQGGDVTTIRTASTSLTAAQFCDSSVIRFTGGPTSTDQMGVAFAHDTIYLVTSSAMIADCIPTTGDSKKTLFWNFSTSTLDFDFSVWDKSEPARSKLMLFFNATSSDVSSATTTILSQNRAVWIEYTNLDGSTSTVTFTPMKLY